MAERALKGVLGVARMQNLTSLASAFIADETITVPGGGYAINDILTIPNGGSYDDKDLRFYRNGKLLEEGQEFAYVGSAPGRTQVELLEAVGAGERLRFVISGDAALIYDEIVIVPGGGYTAGSNITLPASKTYSDIELQVYLNGQLLEDSIDYNYVGLPPRTQIQTVLDLFPGERIRFRIEA